MIVSKFLCTLYSLLIYVGYEWFINVQINTSISVCMRWIIIYIIKQM